MLICRKIKIVAIQKNATILRQQPKKQACQAIKMECLVPAPVAFLVSLTLLIAHQK